MRFVKVLLLAFLICILCVFVPNGMPGMDVGMSAGANVKILGDELGDIVRIRMEKMRSLGITEADEEIERAVVEAYSSYPPDIAEVMDEIIVIDGTIFYYIGGGEYDYDTWEWTPVSKQVYVFDMEAFNVSSMYTDFLHGIMSLMGDDVSITEIEEDASGVDDELGIGTQVLRFRCNGNLYEFQAEAYYDWMDMDVIDFMNGVLKKEKVEKRLLVTYDGGQGCIIFYNTEKWAREFRKTMGYGLLNAGKGLF